MMDKLFKKMKVDLDYDLIIRNRLSILTQNSEWLENFDGLSNKAIVRDKEDLRSLVKLEKENHNKLEKLKAEKKRVIAKIITLSDEINNKNKVSDIVLLEEAQSKLNDLNDEIDDLSFELEMMPKKIREANLRLLESTVEYAYSELSDREEKLENINHELEALREQLRRYIVEKFEHEEKINKLYSFLHNTLGNEKANELDNTIYESKNRR